MSGRPAGRELPRPTADPAAAAYLVAVVLAVVQAAVLGDPGRTLRAAVPFLLGFLVVVVVRAVGPRDETALTTWVRALSVATVLLAVWLLGAFLGAAATSLGEPSDFYRIKLAVTSPVGDHNTAAGLLLPGVVACAAMAAREPRWRAGLVVATVGVVATLSRGAALVLLAVAAVGWVVAGDRRFRALLAAAGATAVIGVLGLALLLDASPPEPTQAADADAPAAPADDGPVGASVVGRGDLALRGLEVGLEHPVLGVGLGAFAEHADDLPPPNDHAHQLLAHALAEGGVPLLLVAVAVPVVLAQRIRRLSAGPGRDVLLLGGLGLVAHAQAEILGGRLGYEVLLALLVGLAGGLAARGDHRPGSRDP